MRFNGDKIVWFGLSWMGGGGERNGDVWPVGQCLTPTSLYTVLTTYISTTTSHYLSTQPERKMTRV